MYKIIFLLFIFSCSSAICQTESELFRKADSLSDSKKYREAMRIYDTLIEINSKSEKYFRGRGFAYVESKNFEKGEKDYNETLKINPSCARCYFNLSRIYGMKNELGKAKNLIDKAIQLYSMNMSLRKISTNISEANINKYHSNICKYS